MLNKPPEVVLFAGIVLVLNNPPTTEVLAGVVPNNPPGVELVAGVVLPNVSTGLLLPNPKKGLSVALKRDGYAENKVVLGVLALNSEVVGLEMFT